MEALDGDTTRVLMCDESNHMSADACVNPPRTAIVISGEWCHEVLNDHGVAFHRGRGIQYVVVAPRLTFYSSFLSFKQICNMLLLAIYKVTIT